MKVRFVKNVLVEVRKTNDEIWDRQMSRWDELLVEKIDTSGKFSFLTTYDGDIFLNVPITAYEVVQPKPSV